MPCWVCGLSCCDCVLSVFNRGAAEMVEKLAGGRRMHGKGGGCGIGFV